MLASLTGKQADRIAGRYAAASAQTRAAIDAAPLSAEARAALAA